MLRFYPLFSFCRFNSGLSWFGFTLFGTLCASCAQICFHLYASDTFGYDPLRISSVLSVSSPSESAVMCGWACSMSPHRALALLPFPLARLRLRPGAFHCPASRPLALLRHSACCPLLLHWFLSQPLNCLVLPGPFIVVLLLHLFAFSSIISLNSFSIFGAFFLN